MLSLPTKQQPTALEVYRGKYRTRYFGGDGQPESKRFFTSLRNTMLKELRESGRCQLVEALLKSLPAEIDVVVYAVLCDICFFYQGKGLTNLTVYSQYQNYIPHLTGMISWAECQSFGTYYYHFYEDIYDMLQFIQETAKERYDSRRTEQEISRNPEPAAEKTDLSVTQAREDAGKSGEQAQDEAEDFRAQAWREAESIRAYAREEAEKIIDDAQARRESILQKAREAAEELLAQARNDARQQAQSLVQASISDQQKQLKQECNESVSAIISEYMETARTADEVHGEMCDKTNRLQASWMRSLDEMTNQLDAMKTDFYRHLREWQASLYPRELKPIAERYLELYRILNVDRLIREEVLYCGMEEGKAMPESAAPAASAGPAACRPETVAALHKLNKTLSTFLRRFEAALTGLGLYVYYPAREDAFDEVWHVCEEEEEGRGPVLQCILPGIAKKAYDGGEDDVVIPAVVRRRHTSDGD